MLFPPPPHNQVDSHDYMFPRASSLSSKGSPRGTFGGAHGQGSESRLSLSLYVPPRGLQELCHCDKVQAALLPLQQGE